MANNPDSAQREIDEAFFEVSEDLMDEELGGRRRAVYYRNRLSLEGEDTALGLPGETAQPWTVIYPTPRTSDSGRDWVVDQVGLVQKGDIQMKVDRLAISREILELAEFYINDDPDAGEPMPQADANYDVIGGNVLEGGGGIRERDRSFWVCFLRKRQSA